MKRLKKLQDGQEIVGVLIKIFSEDKQNTLVFNFQKEIEIPKDAIQKKTLEGLVGERVGIFNCDGTIKVRKIRQHHETTNSPTLGRYKR